MTPIIVTVRGDEASRSPDRPCYWTAEATVAGQRYTARARYGVAGALARVLVAAGLPDAPLHVLSNLDPNRVALRYAAFHAEARMTIKEGPTTPISRGRWLDLTEAFGAGRPSVYLGQNRGEAPIAAMAIPE